MRGHRLHGARVRVRKGGKLRIRLIVCYEYEYIIIFGGRTKWFLANGRNEKSLTWNASSAIVSSLLPRNVKYSKRSKFMKARRSMAVMRLSSN